MIPNKSLTIYQFCTYHYIYIYYIFTLYIVIPKHIEHFPIENHVFDSPKTEPFALSLSRLGDASGATHQHHVVHALLVDATVLCEISRWEELSFRSQRWMDRQWNW